jgi:hypothetical protein
MTNVALTQKEINWRIELLNELDSRSANYGIDPVLLREWLCHKWYRLVSKQKIPCQGVFYLSGQVMYSAFERSEIQVHTTWEPVELQWCID